jgi:hypothetical protein
MTGLSKCSADAGKPSIFSWRVTLDVGLQKMAEQSLQQTIAAMARLVISTRRHGGVETDGAARASSASRITAPANSSRHARTASARLVLQGYVYLTRSNGHAEIHCERRIRVLRAMMPKNYSGGLGTHDVG